jgi:N-acetylneuraminic acid mutarotase
MKKLFHCKVMIAALTAAMVSALFSITAAQHVPWLRKADMQDGRHSLATSMVEGKIYLIGGRYTDDLVSEYDPATDSWTTKTPMPTARMLPASGVVDGKIYVIGGLEAAYQPALSIVEEYDPVTDSWARKEDMLTRRLGHGVSVVDGNIYVIGGMTSGPGIWSGIQDSVEVYDPVTNTWTTKAPIPTARVWLSTSVVDGKIYAIGGAPLTKEPLATVEVYDPATDTWTTKTPMPTARTSHAAAVVDGIIYVIGGGTVSADPGGFSVVEAYNPVTDTWTRKADIPEPRASLSAGMVGGKIYAFGGIPTFADPHLHGKRTVYEYDPSKDLTALIHQFNINKCFAEAGNDSVCITIKLNDPAGVTLWAEIETPDQTSIDSVQLFDDGNHNDGNAADSLYANTWPVNSAEEQQYYMDLHVTQVGTDTVIHYMNNIASFTTIGPVVLENYRITSIDSVPNPGDRIWIKCTLKNISIITTATNLEARLTCSDPLVDLIVDNQDYDDIAAGETVESQNSYKFDIPEECPDSTELQFNLDIFSNHYSFWSDSFSILVLPQTTAINSGEMIIRKFSLSQNYPNPFNPATTIRYSLPVREYVTLKVYDCLGKEVTTLVNGYANAGNHSVTFDASRFSSGLYFYKLQAGDRIETRKMLVIK